MTVIIALEHEWQTWHAARERDLDTIRQRDPEAATRRSFDGVPTFPVDARWIVAGRYIPYDEPRQVEVATARADLRHYVTADGVVHLELGGTAYRLVATVAVGGRIDGPVGLSFHDESNGSETAPWRTVTTGQPGKDGEVVVDFNRTINLPFAFTDYGTCPAPVEGNLLRPSRPRCNGVANRRIETAEKNGPGPLSCAE